MTWCPPCVESSGSLFSRMRVSVGSVSTTRRALVSHWACCWSPSVSPRSGKNPQPENAQRNDVEKNNVEKDIVEGKRRVTATQPHRMSDQANHPSSREPVAVPSLHQ